ncbi:MAG: hypothetical protein MJ252_18685 [archaeon]|nr:hypothetical protein [archaeon]
MSIYIDASETHKETIKKELDPVFEIKVEDESQKEEKAKEVTKKICEIYSKTIASKNEKNNKFISENFSFIIESNGYDIQTVQTFNEKILQKAKDQKPDAEEDEKKAIAFMASEEGSTVKSKYNLPNDKNPATMFDMLNVLKEDEKEIKEEDKSKEEEKKEIKEGFIRSQIRKAKKRCEELMDGFDDAGEESVPPEEKSKVTEEIINKIRTTIDGKGRDLVDIFRAESVNDQVFFQKIVEEFKCPLTEREKRFIKENYKKEDSEELMLDLTAMNKELLKDNFNEEEKEDALEEI